MICANPTKFAIHLPANRVGAQFLRSRACSPLDNLTSDALPPPEPMSFPHTLVSLLAACRTVSAFRAVPAGNLPL